VIGRASGDAIAAEMRVAGTPWVMVLESPRRWVAQRPRETVRQLALLSLAFLGVGAAISWPLSRRLTRPLAALAAAAETIARDGARRPPVARARGDEIVRLSTSFAAMAADVAAARRELERRVDDAQSAADGLALVNWQLREAMDEAQRARADAERAREDAEEANRAKSQFLATMSHELRTPLNAIGGYAQLLDLGVYGPLTPDQRDAVTRVERSQAHLLTLINDVLSFARLDAGQVQYAIDDVPLHEALAELEALVAPQVQATRLRFVYAACDPALAVRADRDKLRQIVLNLLANAIKYTPPGGVVAVACEAAATCVRVRVSDTGTGIPAERLGRIFDPFVQGGRALNRPEEGVGLGLTISRDLARGMGGELEVASEVGRGSVFTVVLPRATAAPPAVAAPRAPLESVATRGARAT
jgi:signal transduction histidine kinase